MANEATKRDRATDLGVIRINNEAISTIASIAAMEVKGVYRMGGGFKRTLHEVFLRTPSHSGVKICSKDGDVKIIVSITVEYGVDVPRVADEVQDNVKHTVERMTGLIISEVDVIVDGVHSPSMNTKDNRRGSTI